MNSRRNSMEKDQIARILRRLYANERLTESQIAQLNKVNFVFDSNVCKSTQLSLSKLIDQIVDSGMYNSSSKNRQKYINRRLRLAYENGLLTNDDLLRLKSANYEIKAKSQPKSVVDDVNFVIYAYTRGLHKNYRSEARVRKAYTTGKLTLHQIERLEQVGFKLVPKVRKSTDQRVDEWILSKTTGKLIEDARYNELRLRDAYRTRRLSESQIEKLQNAGFKFNDDRYSRCDMKRAFMSKIVDMHDSILVTSDDTLVFRCDSCNREFTAKISTKYGQFRRNGHVTCNTCIYDSRRTTTKRCLKCEKLSETINHKTKCVETGKIYDSLAHAARAVDRTEAAVRSAIKRCGLCAGYHWEYVDKYERWSTKPRPVKCIETNDAYDSTARAARSVDRSVAAIRTAINRGGTCAGYHWEYVDDNLIVD